MFNKRLLLAGLCLLVSVGCGIYSYSVYSTYAQSDAVTENVLSNIAVSTEIVQDTEYDINDFLDPEDRIEVPETVEEEFVEIIYPAMDIDFASLKEINSDFVGVLYVPVLDLYHPIAKSHDNNEYLGIMYDGTVNGAGTIFMHKNAKSDWSSMNTIIFGHNMRNESMFGKLRRFRKEEGLCASNPYIYVYTEAGVYKYHIFSYYLANMASDVCYADVVSNDLYDQYVDKSLSRNDYEGDDYVDDFTNRPKLLTLSTCYGTGHKNTTVINSSLVGIGNTPIVESIVEEESSDETEE